MVAATNFGKKQQPYITDIKVKFSVWFNNLALIFGADIMLELKTGQ